jgi:hypothetical protein
MTEKPNWFHTAVSGNCKVIAHERKRDGNIYLRVQGFPRTISLRHRNKAKARRYAHDLASALDLAMALVAAPSMEIEDPKLAMLSVLQRKGGVGESARSMAARHLRDCGRRYNETADALEAIAGTPKRREAT